MNRTVFVAAAALCFSTGVAFAQSNVLTVAASADKQGDTIWAWYGSVKVGGGGGPVPKFVGPVAPAMVEFDKAAQTYQTTYATGQPIDQQIIFFDLYQQATQPTQSDTSLCSVSFMLNADGSVTANPNPFANACSEASGVVVATNGQGGFTVNLPPLIN